MPFYFRKSVKAGPFRFNFSKSGVGVSVGVRGLRLGTGPRGHYVHAGVGGLYYRASLGRAGERHQPTHSNHCPVDLVFDEIPVDMVEVESADVLGMQDEAFSDLLKEINEKNEQVRMTALLGWGLGLAGLLLTFVVGPSASWTILLALPGWVAGKWLDSYRRSAVIFYELELDAGHAYQNVTAAFDALLDCAAKWHVEAGGAVRDLTTWKRNAGATHIVRKKPTILGYKLPSVIKSNVTPPAIHVGKQVIYFLPDVALFEESNRVGAISYRDLRIAWEDSNFIETGNVPRDAQVIGQTWKHPNKSGGPDRRFASNYQIPVCRYEVMHLASDSGLNELLEFSRCGLVSPFASAVRGLAASLEGRGPKLANR